MKNYKIYFSFIRTGAPVLWLATFLIAVVSCTDSDKNDLDIFTADGGFIRFDVSPPSVVGVSDVSQLAYSFNLLDPNGSAASYDLSMYADISGQRTDTVSVAQITSFPASLSFTADDLANLLEISVGDINFGDNFFFSGTVTTKDGVIYSGAERLAFDDQDDDDPRTNTFTGGGVTDDLLDETGYRQAFEFNFIILCPDPFVVDDLIGMWQITTDTFETFLDDGIFEIVAGPGENQITFLDPFAHPNPDTGGTYNIILDFDPVTGAVTVDRQAAWHCNNFGCGFGEGRVDGVGYIFECVDLIKLTLEYTVDAGSYGNYALDMVKL